MLERNSKQELVDFALALGECAVRDEGVLADEAAVKRLQASGPVASHDRSIQNCRWALGRISELDVCSGCPLVAPSLGLPW